MRVYEYDESMSIVYLLVLAEHCITLCMPPTPPCQSASPSNYQRTHGYPLISRGCLTAVEKIPIFMEDRYTSSPFLSRQLHVLFLYQIFSSVYGTAKRYCSRQQSMHTFCDLSGSCQNIHVKYSYISEKSLIRFL